LNLRTLITLCAPLLLVAGCDRLIQESKKPEAPSEVEQPAAPSQVPAGPEALQSTPPEPPAATATPAESDREISRVGGSVTKPVLVQRVPLDYAALNQRKVRKAGVVIVEAVIDEKGSVQNVRTLKALDPEIDAAVLANMRQWKFKPGTIAGKPVPVYYTLTANIEVQ
jgi:protein TonB